MPLVPVTTYQAAWNPRTNNGRILAQLQNNQPIEIPVESADEFIALLLLLGKKPILVDTVSGNIICEPRPVGT